MSTAGIEWSDRYGGDWPDPATVCPGECEGMGVYPSFDPAEWPEGAEPDEVGAVFITCSECGGTGRKGL